MHVKSLKVFCDIVRQRSFSRAARENGVTQSAASQVVQQLEERLGVRLIDRSKRPWVLTSEGELYYQGVITILADFQALEDKVSRLHRQVSERVRVASIYSAGLSHVNQIVRDFMAHTASANIQVQYQHPKQVYELVERDAVDFGLVSYPKETRSIQAIAWRDEPMVLVCAPEHPFAACDRFELERLEGASLIGFDQGLQIRQAINRRLAHRGISVEVKMEFDNIETIKRAIEIDAGVGLLPAPTVERETQFGSLVAVPLVVDEDNPPLVRPLGIIHRRGKVWSTLAEKFLNELIQSTPTSVAATRPEVPVVGVPAN
jgi:DNA-binding transcriptional LysR family regulator